MPESKILTQIQNLVATKDVLISSHGYEELADDHIYVTDILDSISHAEVIEDYPDFGKGPCCLVLQYDKNGDAVHVVWGIAKGTCRPAVLITAYRPSKERWMDDFKRRRDER